MTDCAPATPPGMGVRTGRLEKLRPLAAPLLTALTLSVVESFNVASVRKQPPKPMFNAAAHPGDTRCDPRWFAPFRRVLHGQLHALDAGIT